MIFEKQPLKLVSTIRERGVIVDLTEAESVKYYYWEPGVTGEPSGEYNATILDATGGTVEYPIEKDILTIGDWYFRGAAVFANGEIPADKLVKITVNSINN